MAASFIARTWGLLIALGILVVAQTSPPPQSPTASYSLSLSLTTSPTTETITTRIHNQNTVLTTVIPKILNVTYTITPSASPSGLNSSNNATVTPPPIVLATKLDPAFGVLGALLILTGLPSAFWGHKNRWTSFFLIGFYTLSLVCLVLIIKFGILPAVNPPGKTLRGMFVLSCAVAGVAGGAIAVFFWKAARYFIGGWGGFAIALWIQCLHNGGLIKPLAIRWVFYIVCAVIGFVLCTIPKIHYHVLLISTAVVGSSAFMIGVDCYTTAGLKEFYVWNIGFRSLFPKFTNNGIEFPVSQIMQIELGLIAAVALMGAAVQLRILSVLQRKLKEIAAEQRRIDEEAELHAAERFGSVIREREEWEKEHPSKSKHLRYDSTFSSTPLMKDPGGSSPTLNEGRPRYQSGVSEFMAATTPDDELGRIVRNQSPGALPTLDLGLGIQDDVPQAYLTNDPASDDKLALKRKEELTNEIQTIRRSIDALRDSSNSSPIGSRRQSVTSRRTLSMDANNTLMSPTEHLRPPREQAPRGRRRSTMDLDTFVNTLGESVSRPSSAPLLEDWDSYVQDRKLLQPPTGVTAPIPTRSYTPNGTKIPISPAVADALNQRRKRENVVQHSRDHSTDSSEDIPLSKTRHKHKRSQSTGGSIPVTILPPRKQSVPIAAPAPQRPITKTFEELSERHREKLKGMQDPLTQAEKEQAELEAAKQRWERAKALEREAVNKRQAEKIALLEKRKRSEDDQERAGRGRNSKEQSRRNSRSLSADKLAGGPGSKRISTMKVEDWMKYQTEVAGGPGDRKAKQQIPFPDGARQK